MVLVVAPRAGAWIETGGVGLFTSGIGVAPRAGAWIETMCDYIGGFSAQSPPARGRGLKLCLKALVL